MYVAMLLTDWYVVVRRPPPHSSSLTFSSFFVSPINRNVVKTSPVEGGANPDEDVYIGRSEVAMWMRVVSSWVCMLLYIWSLIAPVLMPDR